MSRTCGNDVIRTITQKQQLASFSRWILTDLLGIGSCNSTPADNPSMQRWTDGLVVVLDAVQSERASVFAMAESSLSGMLLATTHPDRVSRLVLSSPYACVLRTDQPFGMAEADLPKFIDVFGRNVGTRAVVDVLAPSWSGDAAKRRWWARCERLAGGPRDFMYAFDMFGHTDVRPVLGSIQAPTLVLRRRGDRHVRSGHAQDIVERIPDARLVEFDGDDCVWFAGDADSVLGEIESFLTGTRSAKPSNRVLSTVLFTDIVESTQWPHNWATKPGQPLLRPMTASSNSM
jgi:pimeloyl-ACP methyl ester carboxylesterase